jgi:hypothetical protein
MGQCGFEELLFCPLILSSASPSAMRRGVRWPIERRFAIELMQGSQNLLSSVVSSRGSLDLSIPLDDFVEVLHRGFDVGDTTKQEALELKSGRSQILIAMLFPDAAQVGAQHAEGGVRRLMADSRVSSEPSEEGTLVGDFRHIVWRAKGGGEAAQPASHERGSSPKLPR